MRLFFSGYARLRLMSGSKGPHSRYILINLSRIKTLRAPTVDWYANCRSPCSASAHGFARKGIPRDHHDITENIQNT
jgi:hypothetical protein